MENTEKLLVFYCGGFACRLSHKSAQKAIGLGYCNVKVFAAGYPAWKKVAGDTGALSGEAYYMVKDLRPEIKAVYYLEAD